jgi:hypothetical protein
MRVCLLAVLVLFPCVPSPARAQELVLESGGGTVSEVARRGTAVVLEAAGPALVGRREIYRPTPPLRLRHRWILVQDSTFGVVFASASGVKTGLDSFEGDFYLRSLESVTAVELRALVFNVWGDPAGYMSVTVLAERGAGESWAVHPRWRDLGAPIREHRTSIVWVHRTMFDDESILETDLEAVAAGWSHVTGSDFTGLPEEGLVRAVGP